MEEGMSILPCKNCGHSFWAHREGWPRGCLDCPKVKRCHEFKGDDMNDQPYPPTDAFPRAPGLSEELGLTRADCLPARFDAQGREWFSICSRHQHPALGCRTCLVGSYEKVRKYRKHNGTRI